MAMRSRKDNTIGDEEKKDRRNNIVIPYVSGISEKLRSIFNKHRIPVFFKPSNILRQKVVHHLNKLLGFEGRNVFMDL